MKIKNKNILIPIIAIILAVLVGLVIFILAGADNSNKKLSRQLDLGNKYLSEEDYERAIAAFDEALCINPKCVDAYLGLSDAYLGVGDYDEAISVLISGYKETDNKKLSKELERIVGDRVESLDVKGKEDEAIKLMEEIQNDIEDDIFDDKINELKNRTGKGEDISYTTIKDDEKKYSELDQYYIDLFSELCVYNYPGDQWEEIYAGDGIQVMLDYLDSLYREEEECSELDELDSFGYDYNSFWDNGDSWEKSVNNYGELIWGDDGEAPAIYYDYANFLSENFGKGEKYAIYTGHESDYEKLSYQKQFLLDFANVVYRHNYSSYVILFDNTADALNPSILIKYDNDKYVYYSFCFDCGIIHISHLKN